jgi:hypothetical protein
MPECARRHPRRSCAEARGWDALTVTGTEAFREAVWHAARSKDIEVHGYVAGVRESEVNAKGEAPNGQGQAPAMATPPSQAPERVIGRLVDHGAAQYKSKPEAGLSYFLKLRTREGERTLWGVDLERALIESESRVEIGDLVAVESRGAEP